MKRQDNGESPRFQARSLTPDTRHLTPDSSDTSPLTPALRDIRPEDLEALYRLDQDCFEPGIAYSRAELRRFLRLPGAEGVVCERKGRIDGFAIGYLLDRAAHVVTLDVAGDRRRKGIGKTLLGELLRRFVKAGAREACLEVAVENSGAIAFYEGLGFRRRRRIPDYYGVGRHAYEMGKEL